ncbi:TPA: hypothetical protein I7171_23045 [Vibrio vulnificus]|nr:hypothetical protein [Vibrio vulnificus]
MPSHREIQCAYLEQNFDVLNTASKGSLWNSYQILRKTSFYGKLDQLKHFNEEFSRLSIPNIEQEHSLRIEELGEALEARRSLYDGIGDDLLLLAAFENYMCSILLKSGYIVHQINGDRSLSQRQKREKIHISELSEYEDINFIDVTMNGGSLLKQNYADVVSISHLQLTGLENLKDRRNKSHFDSQVYSTPVLNESFFAALEFIINSIETEVRDFWPERL